MHARWREESATTTLEYVLMLALIVMSVLAAYQSLGLLVADEAAAGTDGIGGSSSSSAGGTTSPPGGAGSIGAAAP